MKKKVIIDCDPGMDDSVAIIMATKAPELDVLALTTVNGNYPIDITTENACKMLELLDKTNIPVGRGMGVPLCRENPKDPFTHGKDGQAEAFLPAPTMKLSEKHAVDIIIDTVKANPNEVTLLMLGPMTNLAMALRKAPEIADLIVEVVAISGMFGLNEYAFANATGDTPQSEWNVYVDPESTDIVYRSGIEVVAIGLDVATYFEVDFSKEQLLQLENSTRKEAHFVLNAIRFVNKRGFDAYCAVIDCMAVAYAIDPTFMETITAPVGVETKGELTLGMTVIDRRHHHVWQDLPKIKVGYKADYGWFLDRLMQLILA